jgi:hypothetical protein
MGRPRLSVLRLLVAVAVTASLAYGLSRRDAVRLQTITRLAWEHTARHGDLGLLVQFAAQTGETWDVQVTECGAASPLRADGPPFVLIRGAFSPQFGEQEPDYQVWEFPTIGALAENLRAEAVRTSCEQVLVQFQRRWTAFGFEGELNDGTIRNLASVYSRGLFY